MITKFSVLYVGQIELDNVGRDGTPGDERRYPNARLRGAEKGPPASLAPSAARST